MKNYVRIALSLALLAGFALSPLAFAQDKAKLKLPSPPSIKTMKKGTKKIKDLKRPKIGSPFVKVPALQKKGLKTPAFSRKESPSLKSGKGKAKKAASTKPKAAASAKKQKKETKKEVPAWRKKEKKSEEATKLGSDFEKNCAKLKPGVKVRLDIYDQGLDSIVKVFACMTGKNIILSKSLKGKKITIFSPELVTAKEAERAFYTALEANGYTISKQGKFLRIIDIKDFARYPDPLLPESKTPAEVDRMVTQIITLKHVDAAEINEVLSKMASSNAQFIVYQPNNSLIITELASNLRKLRSLIADLDVPGGQEELWIYQVLHAEAGEIAQKILEVFEKDKSSSSSKKKRKSRSKKRSKKRGSADSTSVGQSELDARVSKVISDDRTNRLLIVSTKRSYRRVKKLIQRLDIAVEGDGQVHIHQLNHAKSTDLANVLSNLSSNQRKGSSRSRKRKSKSSRKSKSKSSKSGATSAALFEGEVSVTADEDTNSLVITASLKDYLALKRVIDVLDRPRRQVFIEAVIMEVSVTNKRDLGIAAHVGYDPSFSGEKGLMVFGNPAGGSSLLDLTSAASLTGLAVQGPPITIEGISLPSFGAVMRALATNTDVNVLSTPHILTTDNEQAEIVVGENVPFVSGFVGGGGLPSGGGLGGLSGAAGGLGGLGGLLGGQNVQRQDVALTLKITPRINAANFVTLEIDQVVEEVSANDPRLGPTTSKRSVKSTVVVKDQNTVVIGGLQKSKQSNSKEAFPFLGEIPIIGYLFRSSKRTRERVNMLLMLTPHVIEGPEDFQTIMQRKVKEHREFVERFHKEGDKLVLNIDYRKKHGVLEAINQSLQEIRDEDKLLRQLKEQEKGPPLPQDIDNLGEDDEDDDESDDESSAAQDGDVQ